VKEQERVERTLLSVAFDLALKGAPSQSAEELRFWVAQRFNAAVSFFLLSGLLIHYPINYQYVDNSNRIYWGKSAS
jgi:hypothetical protein